jgi:HK97 family phage prohead protease
VDNDNVIIRRDGKAGPSSQVEKSEGGDRGLTRVVASSPSPDRYNDIVDPSWNLERYKANPVVQWAHDYSLPPVGRVESLEIVEGSLIADIRWDEETELGKTVASQFRRGYLSAVSVGFAPGTVTRRSELDDEDPYKGESGNVYRNPELLEISAVPIPAHAGALAIRSIEQEKQRHIIAFEENDNTYTVTYAKAEGMEQEAKQAPASSVMRQVFGEHPLTSLFGQGPSIPATEEPSQ